MGNEKGTLKLKVIKGVINTSNKAYVSESTKCVKSHVVPNGPTHLVLGHLPWVSGRLRHLEKPYNFTMIWKHKFELPFIVLNIIFKFQRSKLITLCQDNFNLPFGELRNVAMNTLA